MRRIKDPSRIEGSRRRYLLGQHQPSTWNIPWSWRVRRSISEFPLPKTSKGGITLADNVNMFQLVRSFLQIFCAGLSAYVGHNIGLGRDLASRLRKAQQAGAGRQHQSQVCGQGRRLYISSVMASSSLNDVAIPLSDVVLPEPQIAIEATDFSARLFTCCCGSHTKTIKGYSTSRPMPRTPRSPFLV